jgi:hypothetical protein
LAFNLLKKKEKFALFVFFVYFEVRAVGNFQTATLTDCIEESYFIQFFNMRKIALVLLLSPFSLLANKSEGQINHKINNYGPDDCPYQATLMMDCGDGTGSYYSSSCHDNAADLWNELFEAYDLICP